MEMVTQEKFVFLVHFRGWGLHIRGTDASKSTLSSVCSLAGFGGLGDRSTPILRASSRDDPQKW